MAAAAPEPSLEDGLGASESQGIADFSWRDAHIAQAFQPVPQGERRQCRVVRQVRGLSKLYPAYELLLQDGRNNMSLLLSARKRRHSGGSLYHISAGRIDSTDERALLVGVLQANLLGTQFTLSDAAAGAAAGGSTASSRRASEVRPSSSSEASSAGSRGLGNSDASASSALRKVYPSPTPGEPGADDRGGVRNVALGERFAALTNVVTPLRRSELGLSSAGASLQPTARRELAAVRYEPNFMGFRGPRKMTFVLPVMTRDGVRCEVYPQGERDTLVARARDAELRHTVLLLRNKAPQWNQETQSYVLHFGGRVTIASVKNFQMVHDLDLDYVVMQFGRVADHAFSLDFSYPLCALQAFGIALSAFDSKLACE